MKTNNFKRFLIISLLISASFYLVSSSFFVNAAAGVPKILNYQGRLLDSSGSVLGGSSGTNYCFRFTVWTASSSGSQVWPSSNVSSTMTVNVKSGVFNVGVGDTSAGGDLLDFNFEDNDSVYLNVDVAAQVSASCSGVSFEALAPRQRIHSSGFAINAATLRGKVAQENATTSQIPVLSAEGRLVLGSSTAEVSATSTNNLLFQGRSSGNIVFFGTATGTLTSTGTLTLAGAINAGFLSITGTSTFDGNITFGNAAGDTVTLNAAVLSFANNTTTTIPANAGALNFATGTTASHTPILSVDGASGKIGIGTTETSNGTLTVSGLSGSSRIFSTIENTNTSGAGALSVSAALLFRSGGLSRFVIATDPDLVGSSTILTVRDSQGGNNIMTWDATSRNVGIGTTNPTSRLFVQGSSTIAGDLTATGTITFGTTTKQGIFHVATGTTNALVVDSVGRVGIGTTTFSGLFSVASTTNGSSILHVGANGNVGIGTSTPMYPLSVFGSGANHTPTLSLSSTNGRPMLLLDDLRSSASFTGSIQWNLNGAAVAEITHNNDDPSLRFYNAAGGNPFIFYLNSGNITATGTLALTGTSGTTTIASGQGFTVGASQFVVQGSGNVGIGTTNPTSRLFVQGSSSIAGDLTATGTIAFGTTTQQGIFHVATGTTNALVINSAGNVGIGTTTPSSLLDVAGAVQLRGFATGTTGLYVDGSGKVGVGLTNPTTDFHVYNPSQGVQATIDKSGANTGNLLFAKNTTNHWALQHTETDNLGLYNYSTASWPLYFLRSNNNVGIGTTNPGAKLDIVGTASSTGLIVRGSATTTGSVFFMTDSGAAASFGTTTQQGIFHVATGTTNALVVDSVGRVGIGTTTFSGLFNVASTTNGSSILHVGANGNVGIGSTSPASTLSISGPVTTPTLFVKTTQNQGLGNIAVFEAGNATDRFVITDAGNINAAGDGNFVFTGSNVGRTQITHVSNYAQMNMWDNAGAIKVLLDSNGVSYFNGGNVGIGTTAPTHKLTVNGSSTIHGALTATGTITFGTTTQQGIFHVATGTTNALVISSAGNVGVGTTTPSSLLDVAGTVQLRGFATGTTGLYVNGSGNVGIGTTTPVKSLDIFSSDSTGVRINPNGGGTALELTGGQINFSGFGGTIGSVANGALTALELENAGGIIFNIGGSGNGRDFIFQQNGSASELVRITNTGLVGIGTTSPSTLLHLYNATATPPVIALEYATTSGKRYDLRSGSVAVGAFDIYDASSSTSRLVIDTSGNFSFGTTTQQGIFHVATGTTNALVISNTGKVGIGTISPSAFLDINAGTLADENQLIIRATGTLPASPNNTAGGFLFSAISAGSASQAQRGARFELLPGYTGSSITAAINGVNTSAGTGGTLNLGSNSNAIANMGGLFQASASTVSSGIRIGFQSLGKSSSNVNIGTFGTANDSAAGVGTNIGVLGHAFGSATTSLKNVAGLFTLGSSLPTSNISSALIAHNGTTTDDLFNAFDNASRVFRIADGGNVSIGTSTLQGIFHVATGTYSAIVVSASGSVGIGTTTPSDALEVVGDIKTTACASDGAGDVACVDVAESYMSGETLEAGDIVALSASTGTTPYALTKATVSTTLAGIISTRPGLYLEGNQARFGGPNLPGIYNSGEEAPLALVGRVPVKVNLENGPIVVGDHIAISSISGVGKKAQDGDAVVGIALQPFDGSPSTSLPAQAGSGTNDLVLDQSGGTANKESAVEKILVFIKIRDGVELSEPALETFDDSEDVTDVLYAEVVNAVDYISEKIVAGAKIIKEVVAQKVTALVGLFYKVNTIEIEVGSSEHPTGITLYDTDTGAPYCLYIRNGMTQTRGGKCDDPNAYPLGEINRNRATVGHFEINGSPSTSSGTNNLVPDPSGGTTEEEAVSSVDSPIDLPDEPSTADQTVTGETAGTSTTIENQEINEVAPIVPSEETQSEDSSPADQPALSSSTELTVNEAEGNDGVAVDETNTTNETNLGENAAATSTETQIGN